GAQRAALPRPGPAGRLVRPLHHPLPQRGRGCRRRRASVPDRGGVVAPARRRRAPAAPVLAHGLAPGGRWRAPVRLRAGLPAAARGRAAHRRQRAHRRRALRRALPRRTRCGARTAAGRQLPVAAGGGRGVNPPGPFQVVAVDHDAARPQLRAVREAVFIREQGVPAGIEIDDLDPRCRYVLARDRHGRPIGTARLAPDGRIGRMAVLPEWRGHGVGSALLHALLRIARGQGLSRVNLHAQAGAIDFYRRHGFVPVGPPFMEAGIEHQAMAQRLDRPVEVHDRAGAVAATVAVVAAARRRLCVPPRARHPGLHDHRRALAAPRRFATRGRRECAGAADRSGPAPAERVRVPEGRGPGGSRLPRGPGRQRCRRLLPASARPPFRWRNGASRPRPCPPAQRRDRRGLGARPVLQRAARAVAVTTFAPVPTPTATRPSPKHVTQVHMPRGYNVARDSITFSETGKSFRISHLPPPPTSPRRPTWTVFSSSLRSPPSLAPMPPTSRTSTNSISSLPTASDRAGKPGSTASAAARPGTCRTRRWPRRWPRPAAWRRAEWRYAGPATSASATSAA